MIKPKTLTRIRSDRDMFVFLFRSGFNFQKVQSGLTGVFKPLLIEKIWKISISKEIAESVPI